MVDDDGTGGSDVGSREMGWPCPFAWVSCDPRETGRLLGGQVRGAVQASLQRGRDRPGEDPAPVRLNLSAEIWELGHAEDHRAAPGGDHLVACGCHDVPMALPALSRGLLPPFSPTLVTP